MWIGQVTFYEVDLFKASIACHRQSKEFIQSIDKVISGLLFQVSKRSRSRLEIDFAVPAVLQFLDQIVSIMG